MEFPSKGMAAPGGVERFAQGARRLILTRQSRNQTGPLYLPDICHPRAMAGYLSYRDIRLFDYARWAEPLREQETRRRGS